MVIEVSLPADVESQLELRLTQVNHGYRGFASPGEKTGEKSGSCNVDVVCSQGDDWRDEIRSVGRYHVTRPDGTYLCTGALVNNTAQDVTPYFLTAHHCILSAANAPTVVVYWNYENSTCRPPGSPQSGQPGDGQLTQFNTGAILRADYAPSDMTLLELDDPLDPAFNPHWAGWDNTSANPTSATTIHHPRGEEKRISFENDPTTTTSYGTAVPGDGTHIRVADWDLGTTEPASSGAPLFNPNQRIVGQLHGGDAACGNDLPDWYGRLSVSWDGGGTTATRLRDWLDPGNTGATVLDGVDVPNQPPVADANGPYVTNEGTNVTLDGTGSSDPDGDPLTYEWDLDNDGAFDDAIGPNPTFTMVGRDGVFTIRLRVTDPGGAFDVDETTVTVNNVAPSVSLASDAPKDEGSAVTVSGVVTDPGWLDPLWAEIYWGDGTPPEPVFGVLENVRPDATLTFSVSHVYGDNGTFTAEVCASDDDETTCEPIDLQIDNVDPTAEIDLSGAILVNGVPTFLAHAGDPLDFNGRSTDPGSDDLFLSWDWGDGSPIVTTMYLVNPPFPDPFPSPSIQPRDVTDMQTHTYVDACLYEVRFWAEDDDGGMSPVDTANVVIVGNADEARSAGYWQHQFRSHLTGRGHSDFDQPTLECYLAIAGYMSQVFDEVRDASTFDLAHDVLFVKQNSGNMEELFDRQLLAVWLNFANGSIEFDEMVDTDGDGVADTVFLDAVAAAEAVRLDPNATRAELQEQKDILQRINLRDR